MPQMMVDFQAWAGGISSRSPELQMLIAEFHQKISQALCANPNRNVLAKSPSELQLIASAGDIIPPRFE
jgi:hypothetical protein